LIDQIPKSVVTGAIFDSHPSSKMHIQKSGNNDSLLHSLSQSKPQHEYHVNYKALIEKVYEMPGEFEGTKYRTLPRGCESKLVKDGYIQTHDTYLTPRNVSFKSALAALQTCICGIYGLRNVELKSLTAAIPIVGIHDENNTSNTGYINVEYIAALNDDDLKTENAVRKTACESVTLYTATFGELTSSGYVIPKKTRLNQETTQKPGRGKPTKQKAAIYDKFLIPKHARKGETAAACTLPQLALSTSRNFSGSNRVQTVSTFNHIKDLVE
jgi:hypothetical protein